MTSMAANPTARTAHTIRTISISANNSFLSAYRLASGKVYRMAYSIVGPAQAHRSGVNGQCQVHVHNLAGAMDNPNLPKVVGIPPHTRKRFGSGSMQLPSPRELEAEIRKVRKAAL